MARPSRHRCAYRKLICASASGIGDGEKCRGADTGPYCRRASRPAGSGSREAASFNRSFVTSTVSRRCWVVYRTCGAKSGFWMGGEAEAASPAIRGSKSFRSKIVSAEGGSRSSLAHLVGVNLGCSPAKRRRFRRVRHRYRSRFPGFESAHEIRSFPIVTTYGRRRAAWCVRSASNSF